MRTCDQKLNVQIPPSTADFSFEFMQVSSNFEGSETLFVQLNRSLIVIRGFLFYQISAFDEFQIFSRTHYELLGSELEIKGRLSRR